jgi:hypothetical protein
LEGGFEGTPKEKMGRSFRFNQKGKYIQLGEQMRQEVPNLHFMALLMVSLTI